MKNAFLFCLVLLACVSDVSAQGLRRSLLKVRLADRSPFTIEVDGRRYDKEGASLTVGDLPAGRHSIRIYSVVDDGYGRNVAQLVYRGRVQTVQGTTTFCVVDVARGDMRVRVEGYDHTPGGPPPPPPAPSGNDYSDDNPTRYNREDDRPRNDYSDDRDPAYNSNSLNDRDMTDLRTRVEKRITDTDKEGLLKTALENRSCNTGQLAQLLHLLTFESTKLDFAKWAYSRVTDRSNYWKLESEFTFSSSKDELNKFIQEQR